MKGVQGWGGDEREEGRGGKGRKGEEK